MKNKKIISSLILMVFILMFLGSISNIKNLNNSPEIAQETIHSNNLIPVNFSIMIGDHGIYGNYPNWSYYVDNYDWCTGNGTEVDPYIIEGIYVTNENQTAHISIEIAEHFIIRNVTVSNYAKPSGHHIYAGIYIGKGEYGLIENCLIINCSHGISLAEAKDSIKITNNKFIGSHNDSKTGLGCAILIHEAKGVDISYNNIDNFYSGIVVHDAEEIYIYNNTIKTNFGYISDTGIYFYTVNDSEIIDNDLYGCNFTGHEYEIITSSGFEGLALADSFVNCYNLTIHSNQFYDLDGSLIVQDVPDVPDIPDIPDSPNVATKPYYWILIRNILVVGFIVIAVGVIVNIVKKNRK